MLTKKLVYLQFVVERGAVCAVQRPFAQEAVPDSWQLCPKTFTVGLQKGNTGREKAFVPTGYL
jgi:hypothetical protein